jgi:hypothetical protein
LPWAGQSGFLLLKGVVTEDLFDAINPTKGFKA